MVIAPPADVVSLEAIDDREPNSSAVMEVESEVHLDIEDPEFLQSLLSKSEPTIEPTSTFAGGAYLPADEMDNQVYQRVRAIDRLREYKGGVPSSELPVSSPPA